MLRRLHLETATYMHTLPGERVRAMSDAVMKNGVWTDRMRLTMADRARSLDVRSATAYRVALALSARCTRLPLLLTQAADLLLLLRRLVERGGEPRRGRDD